VGLMPRMALTPIVQLNVKSMSWFRNCVWYFCLVTMASELFTSASPPAHPEYRLFARIDSQTRRRIIDRCRIAAASSIVA
jgi:hypothetical protein